MLGCMAMSMAKVFFEGTRDWGVCLHRRRSIRIFFGVNHILLGPWIFGDILFQIAHTS